MKKSIGTTPDPELVAPCDAVKDGKCLDASNDQPAPKDAPPVPQNAGTGEQPDRVAAK